MLLPVDDTLVALLPLVDVVELPDVVADRLVLRVMMDPWDVMTIEVGEIEDSLSGVVVRVMMDPLDVMIDGDDLVDVVLVAPGMFVLRVITEPFEVMTGGAEEVADALPETVVLSVMIDPFDVTTEGDDATADVPSKAVGLPIVVAVLLDALPTPGAAVKVELGEVDGG